MDYSSLSEAQQQQYQQKPSDQQQPYDPAQAQAYDAYYAYYGASAYYHQPYYSHDYSSSTATSAGYYTAAQPDASAPPADAAQIHHHYAPAQEQEGSSYQVPPGMNPAAVAALSQLSQLAGSIDAAERAMAERQWHAKGEGMAGQPPPPHYQNYPYPVAMQQGASSIRPGFGAMTPYRGGGRRGGGRFRGRGGNRGHIGQHPSRRDGGPPSSRGRGHGRMSNGRGRRLHNFAPDTQLRQTSTTAEPSISAASQEQGHSEAPQRSFLPVAWCDICRVDCNTIEILEQHKNGKRHKRTVQRIQEIQAQQKVIAELQYNTAAKPDVSFQGLVGHKAANDGELNKTTDFMHAASSHVAEANKSVASSGQETKLDEAIKGSVASEKSPTTDVITEKDMETGIQDRETGIQGQILEGQLEPVSDSAITEGSLPDASEGLSKKRRMVGYDRNDRRRGSNRKMMRTGRGGRLFRSFERAQSRPFERPKDRPRDRPRVCTVCNVTCDTLAVFECHLSGKKHISRMSRFKGQGSVYGPISVYIPPNQPTTYPNNGQEPVFYGLQSHDILQQEGFRSHGMLQQGDHGLDSHVETHVFQQSYEVEHSGEAKDAAPESEVKQGSGNLEEVGSISHGEVAVISDPEGQTTLGDPEAREINTTAISDPEGQTTLSDPETRETITTAISDPEGQTTLSDPKARETNTTAISDPEGQTTLSDPKARETNTLASDAAILMCGNVLPIVEDATLPEYGSSISQDVVVPRLDAPVEEPLANIEEI